KVKALPKGERDQTGSSSTSRPGPEPHLQPFPHGRFVILWPFSELSRGELLNDDRGITGTRKGLPLPGRELLRTWKEEAEDSSNLSNEEASKPFQIRLRPRTSRTISFGGVTRAGGRGGEGLPRGRARSSRSSP